MLGRWWQRMFNRPAPLPELPPETHCRLCKGARWLMNAPTVQEAATDERRWEPCDCNPGGHVTLTGAD